MFYSLRGTNNNVDEMQTEQTDIDTSLNDATVLAYLLSNPDFFFHNQDVLPRLRIPHDSGSAVSLIEKQVSVLRGKCGHLENNLRDFIAVARENENLHQRLHKLIQEMITAESLDAIVELTRSSLCANFNADTVHTMLITTPPKRVRGKKAGSVRNSESATRTKKPAAANTAKNRKAPDGLRIVSHTDKHIKLFKSLFEKGQTVCGMPQKEQLDFLLGKDHAHVASAALIPLHHERRLGVVILTSRDESRFAASKGVMFLNQFGELLSRRVHSYGAINATGKKAASSAG
ncbi:MAG: DUF484 family protein [Granulosicoccus sp.]